MIKNLIGTWKFRNSIMTDSVGIILFDPLNNASGSLIYTPTYMEVFLNVAPAAESLEEDLKLQATNISYSGTYDFDPEKQIVTHHVKKSNITDIIGKSFRRKVEVIDEYTIALKNIEPENIAIGRLIYRQLFWQKQLV